MSSGGVNSLLSAINVNGSSCSKYFTKANIFEKRFFVYKFNLFFRYIQLIFEEYYIESLSYRRLIPILIVH